MYVSKRALVLVLALVFALPVLAHETCTVVLNGTNVVPPNGSTALGVAEVRLTGRVLHFDVMWTGLSGDVTGAHLHLGAAGQTGPMVFDLTSFVDGYSARGIWVTSNQARDALREGNVYLALTTADYPNGEIRGQLDCDFTQGGGGHHGEHACVVELSGENEAQPNQSVESGYALLALDGNALSFDIFWTGVTGTFTGAHFHHAAEGVSGPIVFDLAPYITGNRATGTWNLTNAQLDDLEDQEIYVNVHSSTYPAGEIRGQVDCFRDDDDDDDEEDDGEDCEIALRGSNEVPPNGSEFEGEADLRLSDNQDTLFFEVEWDGLTGTLTGAHFHLGAEGATGPVVFDLGPFIDGNSAEGYWLISDAHLEHLLDGMFYVNVHSTTYPDGELRGQVDCDFEGEDDDDEDEPCMLTLSGDNEVPPNASDATGTAELTRRGHTLYFNIMWANLEGTFTGAHFHHGDADEAGPVIFSLAPFIEGNTAVGSWTLTQEQIRWLNHGELYLNVHSTTYPGGEIRVQVDCDFDGDDDGEDCELALSGENSVPPNNSGAEGEVKLELSEDQNTLQFKVEWEDLEGDFTGAHFHVGAAGENGPVIFDLGPFVDEDEEKAEGTWAISDEHLALLLAGDLYVNVHSTQYPNGEIRVQVVCDFNDDDDEGDRAVGGKSHALHGNFPNPFNPETRISFELAEAGHVKLSVYDILGREIVALVNGSLTRGRHDIAFNGQALPSGVYFYRLEAPGFTAQKKMLLLK